jgi:hypothetical protein
MLVFKDALGVAVEVRRYLVHGELGEPVLVTKIARGLKERITDSASGLTRCGMVARLPTTLDRMGRLHSAPVSQVGGLLVGVVPGLPAGARADRPGGGGSRWASSASRRCAVLRSRGEASARAATAASGTSRCGPCGASASRDGICPGPVPAKSDPARIRNFAAERGRRHLRLLSSRNNNYNRDYHAETADGEQNPVLNVFTRDGDGFRHRWATELMFVPRDEGEEPRHVDSIWPIWNVLDMTPGGRWSEPDLPAMQYR